MITKEQLLTILSLAAEADLVSVLEKVRGMHDWKLNELAAEIVMGWEKGCVIGWYLSEKAAIFCRNDIRWKDYWWHPTDSLDAAAALMPKIEEMGLKGVYNAILISITGDEEVTPLEDDGYPCWALTDDDVWAIANATARQRTEAAVLAVAGRCFQ